VADKAVVANGMRVDHDVAVNRLRHVGRLEGSRVLLCAVCNAGKAPSRKYHSLYSIFHKENGV
jgi:hypothetical protein